LGYKQLFANMSSKLIFHMFGVKVVGSHFYSHSKSTRKIKFELQL